MKRAAPGSLVTIIVVIISALQKDSNKPIDNNKNRSK